MTTMNGLKASHNFSQVFYRFPPGRACVLALLAFSVPIIIPLAQASPSHYTCYKGV